ncbi:MAG: response regulator [Methyloligellaceae bacterium]
MINKILIVDDVMINMTFLEMFFLKHDVTVSKAIQASEVETMIETEKFDVSLIDYHMPDINGVTLIRKLQASQSLHRLGDIYMLTADVEFDPVKAGISKLLTGSMKKPLDLDKLEAMLFPDQVKE